MGWSVQSASATPTYEYSSTWLLSDCINLGWRSAHEDTKQFKFYRCLFIFGRRCKDESVKTFTRIVSVQSGDNCEWAKITMALGGPESYIKPDSKLDFSRLVRSLQTYIQGSEVNLSIRIGPLHANSKSGPDSHPVSTPQHYSHGIVSAALVSKPLQTRDGVDPGITLPKWLMEAEGEAIRSQSKLPCNCTGG
jgi:hypothetical protein